MNDHHNSQCVQYKSLSTEKSIDLNLRFAKENIRRLIKGRKMSEQTNM